MLEDIIRERQKKLKNLLKEDINPYPAKIKRTILISEALKDFNKLSSSKKQLFLTGRIKALRDQGNLIFIDLKDESGKIQAVLKADVLVGSPTLRRGKDNLNNFKILKQNLDVGDFLSVSGPLFKTQKGEKSIEVKTAEIITKSLRPLPTQWYGLKDVEERYRKRYLDLILNPEVKEKIISRSKIIETLRQDLAKEGFIEVETPMLQPLPGGALARPFITHHNALNCDFYLRVAPELYLKRLLVAGFEKIYEIGRDFRNEGIDRDHNPEFTMFELYWAYQDWEGLMKFTEKLLKKFIPGKWEKITFEAALKKYAKKDIKKLRPEEIDEIFKKEVRPKIIKPTFVTHYPKFLSPFAKPVEDNPDLTERFQLIVDGMEIVNGFSELNDPVDQRQRMEEQERKYRAGNQEASRLDEDFLEALEYGMPPAAGWGVGIDRLAALVTKSHNVKEIIAFPTLKPR
ncbi:lysine--tRNA ligase [Candidatus Wolfebacteria bacterium CG18_big_fil_WC_8_21_14_2_50_39_7]|uniref:Lysine--tRNA ligase n=3 Tax=Candidatus Wolfeibacteriota TaxID=1752735 RepID=A0A2H0EC23_9BACT|nr:MAG: lysine--tRNA ligase [Candidatus Wolfebacteria bacterium CG18_big_fil_WC_8_21_14_2_50_39_7]